MGVLSVVLIILFGVVLLLLTYFINLAKKKRIKKCVEDEIILFSNNYEFKNVENYNKCSQEVEEEILDHRSKLKLTSSYLERAPWKIKKIQRTIEKYVLLDKKNKTQKLSLSSNEKIEKKLVITKSNIKPLKENEDFNLLKEPQKNNDFIQWNNKFVLIDFETANSSRTSICQIGMIVIENNQKVFTYSNLVKPIPFYFDPINISIHGITRTMVSDAKTFSEIWEEIKDYFNDEYIVLAHNAGFDISSVLKNTLEAYDISFDNFNYGCTINMLKKNPNLILPTYKLSYLAKTKNITFQHHDALEDASVLWKIINEYYGNLQTFYSQSISFNYQLKTLTKSEGLN